MLSHLPVRIMGRCFFMTTNPHKNPNFPPLQTDNFSLPNPEELVITPEFERAEALIVARKNVLIHGKPGTGKSSFIKYIKNKYFAHCPYRYGRLAVLTPTGISALNVQGQTAFSCLRINPKNYFEELSEWPLAQLGINLKTIETFVIDEISMVRADLLDAIDLRLQQIFKTDLPFGGRQIILVGDFYQLPPVVVEDWQIDPQSFYFRQTYGRNQAFCFHSPSFYKSNLEPVEFTRIFRQGTELDFMEHLSAIREEDENKLPAALEFFNKRVVAEYPENTTVLCPRNREVDALNNQKLKELPERSIRLVANVDTVTNWSRVSGLPPRTLSLKKGAFVIILKNSSVDTYMNGTTGVVTDFIKEDGKVVAVSVETKNGTFQITRETWQKMRMNEQNEQEPDPRTHYTQFPLRLGWALTIHKSQGITLDNGCIDVGEKGVWAAGQLYVALSRIRSISGLHLKTPLSRADVITDPQVKMFNQVLQQTIQEKMKG